MLEAVRVFEGVGRKAVACADVDIEDERGAVGHEAVVEARAEWIFVQEADVEIDATGEHAHPTFRARSIWMTGSEEQSGSERKSGLLPQG
jgi:hypothetical protein